MKFVATLLLSLVMAATGAGTTGGAYEDPYMKHKRALILELAPAPGPLRVNAENPRYFSDARGRAVYLTGSHTWSSLQDNGFQDPPPRFDFGGYLDFLVAHNHNFFRLWMWEQAKWGTFTNKDYWVEPMPFKRTGPGLALDGKPKFDLMQFNQAYFDRLRTRVVEAWRRGIYVSVMLFNGWSVESKNMLGNPWLGHPFNKDNNVNGIDGDPDGDQQGKEVHTLLVPPITEIQNAYVRKVINSVNDLDNVLYEISNESHSESQDWQVHLIRHIKEYESTKPKQHPVGMTVEYPGGDNSELFVSPADWVSPNRPEQSRSMWRKYFDLFAAWFSGKGSDVVDYKLDPPPGEGTKVVISDTDHLWGIGGDRVWVWKTFTRGLNPAFMDGYDGKAIGLGPLIDWQFSDPTWVSLRRHLGYTRRYARRIDLVAMRPRRDLASTGYCLAKPTSKDAEYLVFLPTGGTVTVDLSNTESALAVEWFNPSNGENVNGGTVHGGARRVFIAPFAGTGDAVLYLYSLAKNSSAPTIRFESLAFQPDKPATRWALLL